jgi:hypothetical protein
VKDEKKKINSMIQIQIQNLNNTKHYKTQYTQCPTFVNTSEKMQKEKVE